jgi:hypothetical protein
MARITGTDSQGNIMEFIGGKWQMMPEDPGTLGAVAINAGDMFTRMGRSVQDMAIGAAELGEKALGGKGNFGDQFQQQQREAALAEQASLEPLNQQRPVAAFAGKAVPFLAGAPLAGGSMLGTAVVEGIMGGLSGNTPEERAMGAGIGAATGFTGGAIVRVAQGINASARAISGRGRAPAVIDDVVPGATAVDESPFMAGSVGGAQVGSTRVEGAAAGATRTPRAVLQNAGRQITGEGVESPADVDALLTMVKNGIIVSPGQESGNRAAEMLMLAAERNPLFADVVQGAVSEPNRQTLNRAVQEVLGKKFRPGEVAEFTEDSLGQFSKDAGDIIRRIETENPLIKITDKTRVAMDKSVERFEDAITTTSPGSSAVRVVEKIKEKISGDSVSTEVYTTMRSQARGEQRAADKAGKNAKAQLFGEIIEELDAAFRAQVGGNKGVVEEFNRANQRFRLIAALKGTSAVISKKGDINIASFNNQLRSKFKSEFGGDDAFETFADMPEFAALFDLTKALGRFPKTVGDSGTASNLSLSQLFSEPQAVVGQLAARPVLRGLIKGAQPSIEKLEALKRALQAQ